jgi:hypothetical protein
VTTTNQPTLLRTMIVDPRAVAFAVGIDGYVSYVLYGSTVASYLVTGATFSTLPLNLSSSVEPAGLAVGADGSIFVVGKSNGNVDGQSSAGSDDGFIVKYGANRQKAWTKLISSNASDQATAISLGIDGSIYVVGYTSTSGNLNGKTTNGGRDAFVTKFDANGNRAWTTLIGGSGNDRGLAVVTGSDGFIYITGYTDGSIGAARSKGLDDAFVSKLDTNGTTVWTKLLGTNEVDRAAAISIFNSDVYIAGYTLGELDTSFQDGDQDDAFLAKLDSAGNISWTR